jgi:hypothetical protein
MGPLVPHDTSMMTTPFDTTLMKTTLTPPLMHELTFY